MVTAPRPPADRVRGGPVVITLASRGPARAGTQSRVLEAGVIAAPPDVAAQLGTGPLGQVIRRRQVTSRDGAAAALLTSWHPAALADACPGLLDLGLPAGEVPGCRPAWGEDWLSARPPTSAEAREFGIKRGSPVLIARSRQFGSGGQVLEYAELAARAGTRVEYRYEYLRAGS